MNLPEIYIKKLSKWIPSKLGDNEQYDLLLKFYIYCLGIDFSPLISDFTKRIQELNCNFSSSVTASGAVCFFGSLAMSLVQTGAIHNIDEIFTLTSCYILIDHYIDDKFISDNNKTNTINKIKEFIVRGKGSNDDILNLVGHKYLTLVDKIPHAKPYLTKLFQVEVDTMKQQKLNSLTEEQYIEIYQSKGGLTCEAIQSIIGLEVTKAEYDLGACIQLVDDMMDIDDDIELNINTFVTYRYRRDGNLDGIISYCIDQINDLAIKYSLFKIVLLQGIMLSIHINKNKYSSEIIKQLEPHIYFNEKTSKNSLISWFNKYK